MKHLSTTAALAALVLGGLLGPAACTSEAKANTVLGEQKVPEGYTTATVQQLVEEDRWRDQKVVFDGAISKLGCTGCGGVIVADKTWRLSTEPADPGKFRIPVRAGGRLRVWGVLRITGDGFREVKAHRVELLNGASGKEKTS